MDSVLIFFLLLMITTVITCSSINETIGCSCEQEYNARICTIKINCNRMFKYEDSTLTSIKPKDSDYTGAYELHLSFYNIDLIIYSFKNFLPPNFSKDNIKVIKMIHFELLSIPDEVYTFDELTQFEISQSTLESIDLSKFTNRNLQTINVSDNVITFLEHENVISSPINSLKVIDLSYNFIDVLPNNYFVKFPHLQHLNLSNNFIKNLDILSFQGMLSLQTLYLSHNKLESLHDSLSRLENVKELFLDQNKIACLKKTNFDAMTQLQKLNLSSNNITDIEIGTFQKLRMLQILDLSNNNNLLLNDELFQDNIYLESVILSDTGISGIKANNSSLSSLKINLLGRITTSFFTIISKCIRLFSVLVRQN
ncbi:slit homolog 1 protein-like [Amyelois transitella]|uniref:slit homolog 1 protein-like n=1 Tax=Amyelois transitella TaxID=680683 RepID=UPI00298F73E0|nr:slit homolog 1 protein-like [Amyelois transitella]